MSIKDFLIEVGIVVVGATIAILTSAALLYMARGWNF